MTPNPMDNHPNIVATLAQNGLKQLEHKPRILLLYGSLRPQSYSQLVIKEAQRILTALFKNQIDWLPLTEGSVRPTQGRTLAVMQV